MKAAVLNRPNGVFEVEEIEIDKPKGREVLVQVKASGLCHSDIHLAEDDFGLPLPAVFGHELAGVVVEVGPDATEFVVGDHVVGSLVQFCGHCKACVTGQSYICTSPHETLRTPQDDGPRLSRDGAAVEQMYGVGAFAEFALVHENQLVKVPVELPFPQAAVLGCGCITGIGAALKAAKVTAGDAVVVLGLGGVGLNVISGARLAGAARIIAVDVQPAKESLARKFGATDFVDASGQDAVQAVRALVEGGVDHAFEVVGLKATSEQAIKMVRKGGWVYLIGLHKPNAPISVDVLLDLISNNVTITGVLMGSANIKTDIPAYADLYLKGKLNLDDLISQEISITEINDAYEELKAGAIARSVITSF